MTEPTGLKRLLGKYVAPPRFVMFTLLLPIGYFVHQHIFVGAKWTDSAAMAFDLAAVTFMLSLIPFLSQGGPDAIRKHADANDANRVVILIMTSLMTVAVMVAIAGELPTAKQGNGEAIARLVGTLLLIWLFINTVYALHYAHEYYKSPPDSDSDKDSKNDAGGLDFPGDDEPEYYDFLYFSFTLGMTFQTSDVSITARRVRTIALLHCFIAFIFNLGVIAFTINALGGA